LTATEQSANEAATTQGCHVNKLSIGMKAASQLQILSDIYGLYLAPIWRGSGVALCYYFKVKQKKVLSKRFRPLIERF
jgi:hypothetical protein